MSTKASPTLIGAFTLIGIILAGAAAVLFGAGKYFEQTHPILLYFDKSANGLKVGSSVRFGGVRIGSVRSINVLVDPVQNRKIIPVVVDLREKDLGLIGSESGGLDLTSPKGVERAVSNGLRAGMKQESLVTGQLYIEFDILPDADSFVYEASNEPDYPVVPTVGTQMDELVAGIAEGLEKFNSLDLDGVMNDLRDVLSSSKDQVASLNMKQINDNVIAITEDIQRITSDEKLVSAVENLDRAMAEVNELATKANDGIDPLLTDLRSAIARTNESLAHIEDAAGSIQQASGDVSDLTNPRAPVLMQFQEVLRETRRASLALEELSNDLKRNPGSLLRGTASSP